MPCGTARPPPSRRRLRTTPRPALHRRCGRDRTEKPTRRPTRHARGRATTALRPRPGSTAAGTRRRSEPDVAPGARRRSAAECRRDAMKQVERHRPEDPHLPFGPIEQAKHDAQVACIPEARAADGWPVGRRTPRPARGGREYPPRPPGSSRPRAAARAARAAPKRSLAAPGRSMASSTGPSAPAFHVPSPTGRTAPTRRYERRGARLGIRGRNERFEGGATRHRGKE